jgi:hypothetical protein
MSRFVTTYRNKQRVPLMVSLSTAAVMVYLDGCRLYMRKRWGPQGHNKGDTLQLPCGTRRRASSVDSQPQLGKFVCGTVARTAHNGSLWRDKRFPGRCATLGHSKNGRNIYWFLNYLSNSVDQSPSDGGSHSTGKGYPSRLETPKVHYHVNKVAQRHSDKLSRHVSVTDILILLLSG